MDVILGAIIALVIVSSVDRYLNPEEYLVEGHRSCRRTPRGTRAVRSLSRRLAANLDRQRSLSASHRCSITQVSPWLTTDSPERVTVRH